ncbi:type II toxin-antitoxin system RelE/ParE family toxin [Pelobium manganitolerans]|uniref:type II toxin-antitoxin system RelE/ParE family toxin n=1 Tax=Pelobium manganitolerans TaxID=1842495 RepID=UPI000E73C4E1
MKSFVNELLIFINYLARERYVKKHLFFIGGLSGRFCKPYTNWSKQQADKYIELIFAEIHHITQDLNRGKSYENLRDGYRGVKIQSHIIFFRLAKRVGNK